MQAQHIAGPDLHTVGAHHVHQVAVRDLALRIAIAGAQVHHHAAPLNAMARHRLDGQIARAGKALR
ncbi:hypothetical protein D3C72_2048400 [compost metagenome]